MNRKPGIIASALLIAFMGALSLWAWSQIPAGRQIAVHWDATGNPNGGHPPRWPRFAGTAPRIQELIPNATAPVPSSRFATFHKCSFWASIEA